MKFFVIDADGHISYDADKDEPESFNNSLDAEVRAEELAQMSPGEEVFVAKAVQRVEVPLGDAKFENLK